MFSDGGLVWDDKVHQVCIVYCGYMYVWMNQSVYVHMCACMNDWMNVCVYVCINDSVCMLVGLGEMN